MIQIAGCNIIVDENLKPDEWYLTTIRPISFQSPPPPLPRGDLNIESFVPWWAYFEARWHDDSPLIYDENDYEE
jgi:hypothetical protein